jgi:hypothetical protein
MIHQQARDSEFAGYFLPAFCFAQRAFCAALIFARASADIVGFFRVRLNNSRRTLIRGCRATCAPSLLSRRLLGRNPPSGGRQQGLRCRGVRTDLALDALGQAIYDRCNDETGDLVHHSDRGTQCLSSDHEALRHD